MQDNDRSSWLRQLGVYAVALRCFALPLVFDPRTTHAFTAPKEAASRASLSLLAVTLVAFLATRRPASHRWSFIHGGLILVVAAYAVATVNAVHVPTALFGAPGSYLGLATLLDNVVFAIGVSVFVRTQRDALTIAAAAAGAMILVLAYLGVQALRIDPIPWDRVLLFSTFGTSSALSGYLFLASTAAAAVLVLRYQDLTVMYRRGLAALALCGLVPVAFLGARASALALVPVVLALMVLGIVRYGQRYLKGRALLLPIAALAALIGVSAAIALTPVGERVLRTAVGGDTSTTERAVIYRAALAMIGPHLATGVGPDNFIVLFSWVRDPVPRESAVLTEVSPHSWVLKLLTDAGLIGASSVALLVLVAAVHVWRTRGRPGHDLGLVGAVLLLGFVTQGSISVSEISNEWIFWLAIGLIAATPLSPPDVAPQDRPAGRRTRGRRRPSSDLALAAVCLAVGLAIASTAQGALSASQLAKLAIVRIGLNDARGAVSPALEATRRDPGRGEPWNALGAAYSLVGLTDEAVAAYRRAVDVEPYSAIYLVNLAREESKLAARGDARHAEGAKTHARAAVDASPHDPAAHFGYAQVLSALGMTGGDVTAHAAEAARLAPDLEHLLFASTAFERAGDLEQAIAWQRRAVEVTNGLVSARTRLAQLLLRRGDVAAAREAIPPPRVTAVDRGCGPFPWCIRVQIGTMIPLRSDPAGPDSVTNVDNFSIEGFALQGARLTWDGSGTLHILTPTDRLPPPENVMLTIRRVSNSIGFAIQPDPVSLPVR